MSNPPVNQNRTVRELRKIFGWPLGSVRISHNRGKTWHQAQDHMRLSGQDDVVRITKEEVTKRKRAIRSS